MGAKPCTSYFTTSKARAKHSKKVNGGDGRRTLRECTIEKALMDPIFNGNKGLIGPVRVRLLLSTPSAAVCRVDMETWLLVTKIDPASATYLVPFSDGR